MTVTIHTGPGTGWDLQGVARELLALADGDHRHIQITVGGGGIETSDLLAYRWLAGLFGDDADNVPPIDAPPVEAYTDPGTEEPPAEPFTEEPPVEPPAEPAEVPVIEVEPEAKPRKKSTKKTKPKAEAA